jgi:hypothetical protein
MSKKNRLRAADDPVRLQIRARREEARAVGEGVAETLALEARRGAAFTAEEAEGPGRGRPYRRQPGLDWLAAKGRISAAQKAAGLRYRDAFIVAQPTLSLASTLEVQPGMSAGGASLKALIARADVRQAAERKLALYRRQLADHPALVCACDQICGRELTPREAAGGEREGLKLEAVLLVALDLLVDG